MIALFVVRRGAHYLQGEAGWGARGGASSFPRAQADKLAAEWQKMCLLPDGRMAVEPLEEVVADEAPRQLSLLGP